MGSKQEAGNEEITEMLWLTSGKEICKESTNNDLKQNCFYIDCLH